jgi:SAM-dependent methyltransferase
VNEGHEQLCSSREWGDYLATEVLPNVLAGVDLGDCLLEIGPGFGLATDVLCTRVAHVTAVEIDPDYAARLAARLVDGNVRVVEGDATAMDFPDAAFTAAASFTMLHHVPTPELQDRLFAEVARELAPGAAFIGSDSLDSPGFRAFHAGDTCVPVDPAGLASRLTAAGFSPVRVTAEWSVDPDESEGSDEVSGLVSFVARRGDPLRR